MNAFNWSTISKRIRKRDKYTCQDCGARSAGRARVKFNVHHIIPLTKGGKTRDDNLITLCRECHKKRHHKVKKKKEGVKMVDISQELITAKILNKKDLAETIDALLGPIMKDYSVRTTQKVIRINGAMMRIRGVSEMASLSVKDRYVREVFLDPKGYSLGLGAKSFKELKAAGRKGWLQIEYMIRAIGRSIYSQFLLAALRDMAGKFWPVDRGSMGENDVPDHLHAIVAPEFDAKRISENLIHHGCEGPYRLLAPGELYRNIAAQYNGGLVQLSSGESGMALPGNMIMVLENHLPERYFVVLSGAPLIPIFSVYRSDSKIVKSKTGWLEVSWDFDVAVTGHEGIFVGKITDTPFEAPPKESFKWVM